MILGSLEAQLEDTIFHVLRLFLEGHVKKKVHFEACWT
jgi:hypothetical protein